MQQGDFKSKRSDSLLSVITSREDYGHLESIHNLLGSDYEEKKAEMALETQVDVHVPQLFSGIPLRTRACRFRTPCYLWRQWEKRAFRLNTISIPRAVMASPWQMRH